MAMWKSCILAGPENIELRTINGVFKKLKTELLSSVSGLQVACSLREPEEASAVQILIGRLLDAGRLETALRICAIFTCRNRVRMAIKFLIKIERTFHEKKYTS